MKNPRTKRRLLTVACGWVLCASTSFARTSGSSEHPLARGLSDTLSNVESATEMADARARHHEDPMERNVFVHENIPSPTASPESNPGTPTASPTVDNDTSGGTPSPTPQSPTGSPIAEIPTVPTVGPTNGMLSPSADLNVTLVPTLGNVTLEPTLEGNETASPTLVDGTSFPTTVVSNGTLAPTELEGGNSTLVPTISSNDTLAPTTNSTLGPESDIETFLTMTVTDDGSLKTEGSPQAEALVALLGSSPDLDPTDSDDKVEITQRYSLNTLYFATNGASWVNSELWTSASHPCGSDNDSPWFGVQCSANSTNVESIILVGNDMLGTIPSEIRGLSSLVSLELDNNQISGSIPAEIGFLTNVVSLSFSLNFLSGTLPDVFSELGFLKTFEGALNFLSGPLPPSLLDSDTLEVLALTGNQLSGSLPENIGGMVALKELRLDLNGFSGSIPMNLTQLEELEVISLSQNFLSGLPAELSTLPLLRELLVSANFLSELPEAFVNEAPKLEILNISRNVISADGFPTRFESSVLSTFDASFNPIDSAFNISLFNGLVNLQNIYMAGCSIVATLPADINQLQNLVTLDLDSNLFLSGTIPATLGEIPSLQSILLGSNLLNGTIPTELAQLLNLTNLELQFNFLSGTVPAEFETLSNLMNFNCTGNEIEGC